MKLESPPSPSSTLFTSTTKPLTDPGDVNITLTKVLSSYGSTIGKDIDWLDIQRIEREKEISRIIQYSSRGVDGGGATPPTPPIQQPDDDVVVEDDANEVVNEQIEDEDGDKDKEESNPIINSPTHSTTSSSSSTRPISPPLPLPPNTKRINTTNSTNTNANMSIAETKTTDILGFNKDKKPIKQTKEQMIATWKNEASTTFTNNYTLLHSKQKQNNMSNNYDNDSDKEVTKTTKLKLIRVRNDNVIRPTVNVTGIYKNLNLILKRNDGILNGILGKYV